MENLKTKNNYLFEENKKEIKKIWLDNFIDDDEYTVDLFLEKVFENKKGVGAFLNNELIAIILFLNTKIIFNNKISSAVYFYAVCTNEKYRNKGVMKELFSFAKEKVKEQGFDLCFLVPENEPLFKMYEKFGFKKTINYTEKVFSKNEYNIKNTIRIKTDFCYKDYVALRKKESEKTPVVVFEKDEFCFWFDKNRKDVSFIFVSSGYAIYEKTEKQILIFEFCGCETEIINALFQKCENIEKIVLRKHSEDEVTDFGMTFSFDDKCDFTNIYFGIPYR